MTIVDLTGMGITEVATWPGVVTIAGVKIGGEIAGGWSPPMVVVEQLGIDYSPLGRTRGAGLQAQTLVARCYGATRPQASQLANAVVECIDAKGPRRGTGNRLVYLSVVESGGNVELEPITKWPYALVVFTLVGAQQAVPVA